MKINRRFRRNIKNNLSFYISASLLTAISVFLMVTLYTSVKMIDEGFKAIIEEGNLEDAQFKVMVPIDDEGIRYIETTYDTELEEVHYVDIEENGYTLRAFAPTEKINRYLIQQGRNISSDKDILLNRNFADAHRLSAGSSLTVGETEYEVAGIAVRPDYLYPQKNTADFYHDSNLFGQVTMSRAAFDKLENTQSYYSIIYHKDNSTQVRKYINGKYFTLSYMSAKANNRIEMSSNIGEEYGIMVGMLMPVMFAMIAVIVAVVLNRKVRKEQKQIGTLVALGYSKWEMIKHYAFYAMIPGVIGSVAGIAATPLLLKPVCLFFATDFERINYDMKLNWIIIIISLLIPSALYILTSVFTVTRLLRKNTVKLLSGTADEGSKKRNRFLTQSRISFKRKFQFRSLLKHKSRTFVVIMGMFVGSFVCALGFIMIDSCNSLIKKNLDASGAYEYQYFLNTIETAPLKQGEPLLSVSFEVEGQKSQFALSGLTKDQHFINLATKSGRPVEYGKYYMTSNAAALYGVKAGDDFTFINILSTEKYTVNIADIISDNTQRVLYTSSANAAELLGVPEGSYNVIISDTKLSPDKDKIIMVSSKEELKAQCKKSIRLFLQFTYVMLLFGAILCIITVYLTVNMLIDENRVNISMLEVLGYNKKEISRLVLNTNHILLPISFLIGIWFSIKLCEKMFEMYIDKLNIYIETIISVPSMLICLSVIVLSYYASLRMLKAKLLRINMVESLKDNRQ